MVRRCTSALLVLLVAMGSSAQEHVVLPDSTQITLRSFDTTRLAVYRADRAFDYGQDPETESPFKLWWEEFKMKLKRLIFGGDSFVGNVLHYALLIGVVLLLIYHFRNVRSGGFFNRRASRRHASMEVFKEKVEVKSLASRIDESVAQQDYRSAYRWLYIKLLATMREKDLIRTDRHKTNRDYIRDMEKAGMGEAFTPLAEAFDYIWYGDYPISEPQFVRYSEQVAAFEQEIAS